MTKLFDKIRVRRLQRKLNKIRKKHGIFNGMYYETLCELMIVNARIDGRRI